jgi:hypothetical protein
LIKAKKYSNADGTITRQNKNKGRTNTKRDAMTTPKQSNRPQKPFIVI